MDYNNIRYTHIFFTQRNKWMGKKMKERRIQETKREKKLS